MFYSKQLATLENICKSNKIAFCITLRLLKYLQPPANLEPPNASEGDAGIGLKKVSASSLYGGASKCFVFFTMLLQLHDAQCTMHNAKCTMHNAKCTMHNAKFTMY